MGTTLTGLQVGSSYSGLLKTTDNAIISGTLRTITDGLGNDTALQVSSAGVASTGTLAVTGVATFTAQPILSSLTASSAVATDASKGLVSVTNTGTGNNVLATSPTLVTPILGTPTSGNLVNCTGYVGTSALVTVGALNSGSITSGFGSIDVGADSITGGAISGTTGGFGLTNDGSGQMMIQVAAAGTSLFLTDGTNSTLKVSHVASGNKVRFTDGSGANWLEESSGGAVTFSSSLSAQAISGTTGTFSGTLSTTGNGTIGGTLGVTGATTLSSTLTVTGLVAANAGIQVGSGTGVPTWTLGSPNTVSPTAPNRTLTVTVAGTTYYIAAKTTND